MAAEGKSKVLVIGATGYVGKHIAMASIEAGNPTFIHVRKTTIDTFFLKYVATQIFERTGATVLYGDLFVHESLVSAIKQVDVVISAVGTGQISEQTRIIDAIKEAGNVKAGELLKAPL